MAWIDSLAVGMISADTLQNFRQANRRVANVAACQASAESTDAESKRSKAASILNALRASRTIRTNKTMGKLDLRQKRLESKRRSIPGHSTSVSFPEIHT